MAMGLQQNTRPLLTVISLLIICNLAYGRFISYQSDLVSDGIGTSKCTQFICLPIAAEEICDQTNQFMPCTSITLINLFLVLLYGYLMFLTATYLSSGSELLLEILRAGLVGSLFLPILRALPDAMLIVVSGISGNTEVFQSQGLKEGHKRILIATYLVGRGIDTEQLNIVINYDMPDSADTYLHR